MKAKKYLRYVTIGIAVIIIIILITHYKDAATGFEDGLHAGRGDR